MKEIIVKVNNGNFTLDDTIVKNRETAYKMAEQPENIFCRFG